MPDASFVAETTFHVRYVETDAQGVVNHTNYVIYFEEGRSEYIRQRGMSYAEFEQTGYYLAVTELHVKYLRAAHYDDRVTVCTWVSRSRSRSITFDYEIIHGVRGDCLVTGSSTHVCLDRSGQIARIPDEWQHWAS